MEKSLVLIKPDAMERGLATEILSRLEGAGGQWRPAKNPATGKSSAGRQILPYIGERVAFRV